MTDERYSRQVLFDGIGEKGQILLENSSVVIMGCGALGAVQAETLARAGVGKLILVDRDFVERSNLQRQVMFDEQDAVDGLPKAVAAARRIGRLNSSIQAIPLVVDVNFENVEEMSTAAPDDSNALRRNEPASGFDVPEPVEEPSDAPQAPAPQAPKAPEEDDQQ